MAQLHDISLLVKTSSTWNAFKVQLQEIQRLEAHIVTCPSCRLCYFIWLLLPIRQKERFIMTQYSHEEDHAIFTQKYLPQMADTTSPCRQ